MSSSCVRGQGLGLRVHLQAQQLLGGDLALRGLRRDEALRDELVEHLPADLVLLLPQAGEPAGDPLVELGGEDRRAVHLGDDAAPETAFAAGGSPGRRRQSRRVVSTPARASGAAASRAKARLAHGTRVGIWRRIFDIRTG